jgi:DNA (cytosine-5)-methyltransferase 1
MMAQLTAVDLFCGAGGLSEGFRQAGFVVLAGNDLDGPAGVTFAATHRDAKFLPGPIQTYRPSDFLRAAGLKSDQLDVLIGGPPCQGFSVYNHQRGLEDERSSLYKEYLRIVEGLRPKWVVLENVTGMTSAGGGGAVLAIMRGLKELGYVVGTQILKAEQFGVPQERRRIFFIANRIGAPIPWPSPSHGDSLKRYTTVREAISDLPILRNGQDRGTAPYATEPACEYQARLRGSLSAATNHSASRLSEINVERMKHIPQGGSWRDIPFDLLPAGMKKAKRSDHTKRYGRLSWGGLASTILTKCDPHWGAFFHPTQNRAITVREAARLQSFPDWFQFEGSRTEQYIQVGNAVPPLLGRCVAAAIRETVKYPTDLAFMAAAE